ncbi:bidirectional sugar transporter SWEET17-like [Lycium ferocissimum]|uniref:bidirectional sugar transporter SWEET17-like n=1 Tax=Lycium ferocissimum TaxID=112874 RepID=UPI00281557F3|nr:bidirectional sugar transporter SWEET17-like [Lycium ferocissimum]
MENLPFIIGVIGNIISVFMFLSPVETFRRIVKNRSTEDFDSLPYICTLLNSSLWTYYGLIRPGSYLVSTVNGFGVIVEIIYVALFLQFAHSQMRNKTAILAGVLNVTILGITLLLAQFLLHGEMRINVIGFMATGLNIIMYSSPLGVMKTVVTTKSVEYMPFLLSFFLFLNGGVWALYALLVDDWFLGVPNGMGWFLGAVQLVIYAIYRNSNSSKQIAQDLEQGDQTECLLPPSSSSSAQE